MTPRPIPADFAQVAPTMTAKELQEHYKAGASAIYRWIDEIGDIRPARHPRKHRSAPADFAKYAAVETNPQLLKRFKCGAKMLQRWRRETGIRGDSNRDRPTRALPAPDGFELIAPGMTEKQLRERFGRSSEKIRKWCAEAGVAPRRAGLKPGAASFRFNPQAPVVHRDVSRPGLAADFLRRFGPVYRCGPNGRPMTNGLHWNRGGHVLTDEEIISRAIRNGWKPESWSIAA